MSNDREWTSVPSPEGRYVNNFRIGWNAQEFLLDFGQLEPGSEDAAARFLVRLVLVPTNSRRLLALLEESVKTYEDTFGIIRSPDE